MRYFDVIKKISFVSAGNILNAGFGFVFLAACAKILNVSDFGKYALLTTLLVFMSKVVDFGSNSVFVAELLKTQDKETLIQRFYSLKIALFVISVFLSVAILYFLGFNSLPIITIFIIGLIFYSVNVTFFAIFQSLEMFTHAVLLNTVPAFFKAVLGCLILFNLFMPTFTFIYAIFSLSMGLCIILSIFIPKEFKFNITRLSLKSGIFPILIFKSSAPAGVSQLISQGWSAISSTIIKISKGFSDVGIFYLADKIANVFNIISLSIFTVILPQNARRKKENLPHDLRETALLGLLVLFLAFGFISVSGIFIDKFFGNKFSGSLLILDILILSSAVSAVHSFMENYFYVHDNTKIIMHIALIKLVVFVGVALVLIPTMSLKGLAFSQLISAILGLAFVSFMTVRSQLKV